MVRVKKIKFLNIYAGPSNEYIVHNTRKPFSQGHTHITNYHTAVYLAELTAYHRIPEHCKSAYLLTSLIRLSDREDHRKRLESMRKKILGRKH